MKDNHNTNLHKIQKPENDDALAKRSIVDQTKMSEHNYRKCFGNCPYFIVEINLFRDAHDDPTRWWRLLTSTFPYALRSLCCVGYTFVRSHVKYHSSTGTVYTCFIARVWVTTHLVTLQVCLISSLMAHCLHYITSKIDVFQPIPMKRGTASFFLLNQLKHKISDLKKSQVDYYILQVTSGSHLCIKVGVCFYVYSITWDDKT